MYGLQTRYISAVFMWWCFCRIVRKPYPFHTARPCLERLGGSNFKKMRMVQEKLPWRFLNCLYGANCGNTDIVAEQEV